MDELCLFPWIFLGTVLFGLWVLALDLLAMDLDGCSTWFGSVFYVSSPSSTSL